MQAFLFHFVLFCLKIVQRNWGCHFLVDPRGSTRNSRMEAVLSVQKCLNLSIFASFLEFLWENCQRKLRSSTPSFNMFAKSENAEDGDYFQCENCLKLSNFASICEILWENCQENGGCKYLVDPRGSTRNLRMEAVLSV